MRKPAGTELRRAAVVLGGLALWACGDGESGPTESSDLEAGESADFLGGEMDEAEVGGLETLAPPAPAGSCTSWSDPVMAPRDGPSQAGQDLPGVSVFGTGVIGEGALRIEVAEGVSVEFKAGSFFDPKAWVSPLPQPLMLPQDVLLNSAGSYVVSGNCMKHGRPAPTEETEFYSRPREPGNKVQLCQKDCGNDQECIWECEELFVVETFRITDLCDDGLPLEYRLFDMTQCRVWPSASGSFTTAGLGVISYHELECELGATLCFGGQTGPGGAIELGRGLTGALECSDCCTQCGDHLLGKAGISGFKLSCN